MSRALLVIDVQNVYMEKPLFGKERMVDAINGAIAAFRKEGSPVVFVRHGGKLSPRGSSGWEVFGGLDRRPDDVCADKLGGDAFVGTGLGPLLQGRGVDEILVCGLVSQGCVRATCLGGLAAGFKVCLLEGGHSTWTKGAEGKIRETERELAAKDVEIARLAPNGATSIPVQRTIIPSD